jgi:hypothetical protein
MDEKTLKYFTVSKIEIFNQIEYRKGEVEKRIFAC